jgi:hypothetical protein
MHEPTHIEFEVDAKIFVIVAARSSRRESLRTLIMTIEPRCCVEMAPSVKDLAFLPSASHLSMVVFDLEFETRESMALIPLLAQRWPDTEVVALYNAVHQAPIAGLHIWPWQQAEKAIRRSLHGVAPPAAWKPPAAVSSRTA